jgi:hypothetical protein
MSIPSLPGFAIAAILLNSAILAHSARKSGEPSGAFDKSMGVLVFR